jgi:hypothetical protein
VICAKEISCVSCITFGCESKNFNDSAAVDRLTGMPSVLEEVEAMRPFRFFFLVLVLFPLGSLQPKALSWSTAEASVSAASPEMDRLAQALVGDWDTVEMMEPGPFFPEGGSRKGNVDVRLAAGGYGWIYIDL